MPRLSLNLPNLFSLSAAQAKTILTLEAIRMTVLNAPIGTFKMDDPCGQWAAPARNKT